MPINLKDPIPGCKNFSWHVALWQPKLNSYATPTPEQGANIQRLAAALQRVRDYYGKPFNIHCWLRSPEYNKLVGGAPHSAHLDGLAVDFNIPGVDSKLVQQKLQNDKDLWPGRGEIGVNWCHLDLKGTEWFKP